MDKPQEIFLRPQSTAWIMASGLLFIEYSSMEDQISVPQLPFTSNTLWLLFLFYLPFIFLLPSLTHSNCKPLSTYFLFSSYSISTAQFSQNPVFMEINTDKKFIINFIIEYLLGSLFYWTFFFPWKKNFLYWKDRVTEWDETQKSFLSWSWYSLKPGAYILIWLSQQGNANGTARIWISAHMGCLVAQT